MTGKNRNTLMKVIMIYPIKRRRSLASGLTLLTVSPPHHSSDSLKSVYHVLSFGDKESGSAEPLSDNLLMILTIVVSTLVFVAISLFVPVIFIIIRRPEI